MNRLEKEGKESPYLKNDDTTKESSLQISV